MTGLGIFLIVVGAVLLFIFGGLLISVQIATKNEKNWNMLLDELERQGKNIPEEMAYQACVKAKNIGFTATVIGLILCVAGVLLLVL